MSADKVLLLSFPKSGSNWVRYCVEHFSGRRTPGKARRNVLVSDGPTVVDRMHSLDLYARGPDQPESRSALFDFTYHSRALSPETRQALKAYCQSYLGAELYEQYLGCFDCLRGDQGRPPDHALEETVARARMQ